MKRTLDTGNMIIKTLDKNNNGDRLILNLDEYSQVFGADMIISGMIVSEKALPDMSVQISQGVAEDNTTGNFLSGEAFTTLTIPAADGSLARFDTIETRRLLVESTPESRQFKDPITTAISTATVNTVQEYITEVKVLAGIAGSGISVVAEPGWIKIAEILVPAASSAVIDANIYNVDAVKSGGSNTNWTNNITSIYRNGSISDMKTFLVDLQTEALVTTGIKNAIAYGKPIGELFYLDSLRLPAAYSSGAPGDYFPAKCLDDINVYEDITVANWPSLVPHLRAKALTYNEGITGQKSAFDVTDWDITSNIATLTFANTTAENAILTALAEDNLVHGSFANWRSITLGSAIGTITAGEYAITAIDTSLRTVKFAFTAANGGASGAFTSSFYTNRVPGSSTTARLYQATGRTLVSANDGVGINGLRKRDRFQSWQAFGTVSGNNYWGIIEIADQRTTAQANTGSGLNRFATAGTQGQPNMIKAGSDGVNGTPRTGLTTHGPESVGHLYIHGRSYVA